MADEDKSLEQELREIQEEQQLYGGCNNCQGQHCPDCN